MRGNRTKSELFAATVLAGLVAPVAALAAQQDEPPARTNDSVSLTEIIVTALKRSESVQDVPAAITAVSGQMIQERGVVDPQGLQFAVPSLQVGTDAGSTRVSVRGVGLNQRQGSPGVGIYVDDVYQPRPALGDLVLVDMERVEVLRGPQGTLYGRNTNGGAVNFISKTPGHEFGGYVLAGAKSYEAYRLQGQINVPLGDKWAARAVVNYDDREEGFIKNVVPGQSDIDRGDILSTRLRLKGDLTDDLTLNLSFTSQNADGAYSYLVPTAPPSAAAVAANPYLAGAQTPTDKYRTSADSKPSSDRNFYMYAATATWNTPIGVLKSISGYQKYQMRESYDADGTNVSAFVNIIDNRSKTFTQEFDLSQSFGPVDAILGAFYMNDRRRNDNLFDFPIGVSGFPPGAYLLDQQPRIDTQSWASYADATWRLTDKLRLIGGMRYSVDKQEVTSKVEYGVKMGGAMIPIVSACPLANYEKKFDSFTPRGGVQYDLSDEANIYGSVSRGFKAGGINTSDCGTPYQPEKITAYEGGFKSRMLSRRLIVNIAGFYYDYTGLQVDQILGLTVLIRNAASAKIKGVELETTYLANANWTFNGSASYLDATYDKFINLDPLDPAAGPQSLGGNRLNNSPKWSLNAGASYTTDKMFWGALTARADVSYRSKVYFREFNLPLDAQQAYTVVNLSAIWKSPDDKYSVRIFGDNVADTGYYTTMNASSSLGARTVTWGTPRQVGVELKAAF